MSVDYEWNYDEEGVHHGGYEESSGGVQPALGCFPIGCGPIGLGCFVPLGCLLPILVGLLVIVLVIA